MTRLAYLEGGNLALGNAEILIGNLVNDSLSHKAHGGLDEFSRQCFSRTSVTRIRVAALRYEIVQTWLPGEVAVRIEDIGIGP
jgi:hypothetical protein